MSNLPFAYNVAIEGKEQVLIDWGNSPDWVKKYDSLLDEADRISLIPKDKSNGLPVVTAHLDNDKRWIIFSRVAGQINGPNNIRLYAIGWQQNIKGINIKSIQWVYPGGTVENAEEPTFIDEFLK